MESGSLTAAPTWDDVRRIALDTRYSNEFLGSVVRRIFAAGMTSRQAWGTDENGVVGSGYGGEYGE